MAESSTAGGRRRLGLFVILGLGLTVRLLALWLLPNPDFPDARAYVTAGRELLSSGMMHVEIYMPLYPIWTAIWGGGISLRLADIVLSVAMIWIIYELSFELFRDIRAARLAAVAAAIYPHFIFYSVVGLTETAYLFVLCGAFLLLYRDRYVAGSALLVASILIRPSIDLLAPILVVLFAFFVHRRTPIQSAGRLLAYALCYVILMAPWWAHNIGKYGEFVRLTLGDGVVLYSGNNPLNQSGGGVDDSTKGTDMDRSGFIVMADPIQRNQAYRDAALAFISENPGRFVELAAIKFVRFWRLWPYAPEFETPTIIAVSLLSYGVMLVLAIVFLWRQGLTEFRKISPILLWAAYLTLVHMITIGSVRYRLPLEPFVIIFGCRTLSELGSRLPLARRALDRLTA
jgi:hypothetical protein